MNPKVRVIAEAGQCNGNLNLAHSMVDAAYRAGCWGFKVQMLTPAHLARADAAKYWTDTLGTANQREAFTEAGVLRYEDWYPIVQACQSRGLEFIATPFDLEAVDQLGEWGVRTIKIASGDITHPRLLEAARRVAKRLIISTGAAYGTEIRRALDWVGNDHVTLLACSLEYPTPSQHAELARIETIARAFPWVDVGYSDHTISPYTSLAATALGAIVLEKHFTLDRNLGGSPDHKMALTPEDMSLYVKLAYKGAYMRGTGALGAHDGEAAARVGARRSIVARRAIRKGQRITEDDLDFLRPGDGIPAFAISTVVGSTAAFNFRPGEPIRL